MIDTTSRDEHGVHHLRPGEGPAVTTSHDTAVNGVHKIVARASATVVHSLPKSRRLVLIHPRWSVQFVAEELIEVLALVTQNAIGQELPQPTWRYDVAVSGHRLNRRGTPSKQPEVGVFAPEELPAEYRSQLRGAVALYASIAQQASTPLPFTE